jgi:hypothetical protein
MRGHLNLAGRDAKPNVKVVEHEKNPQLLVHCDLDAFYVCRTYERSLEEGNVAHSEKLKEANPDLAVYFRYLDRQWIKKSANTKVDQLQETV